MADLGTLAAGQAVHALIAGEKVSPWEFVMAVDWAGAAAFGSRFRFFRVRSRPTVARFMSALEGRMRSPRIIIAAAVALAGFVPAAQGWAQTPGELRIYEENDFFNPFTEQTDRYYTQGLRVEWLSSPQKADAHFLPGITHSDWCRLVCGDGFREGSVNTGFAVGQSMYTPANITVATPQINDRPWAGLLYGSRIARISYDEPRLASQRQDRIEVSLGMVGPASLAKEAQIGWHRVIGAPRPAGWDNQLRNEPILQLRYETALRWPRKEGGNADIIPRVRANLGNALTSLEAEVTGRIGWNLSGFGVSTIVPGAAPPPDFDLVAKPTRRASARWLGSGNLFVRASIDAVAHNITLDGNTFAANGILVSRKPFVPEIAAGFEVNIVGNFWLSYQFIHRGSDFSRRKLRDAPPQDFGSLSLAWTLGR